MTGQSRVVPLVGMIVNYKLTDANISTINARRSDATTFKYPGASVAHYGNYLYGSETVPLIIVRVWPNGLVNGQAMLDGQDTLWVTSVSEGDGVGQFSYINNLDLVESDDHGEKGPDSGPVYTDDQKLARLKAANALERIVSDFGFYADNASPAAQHRLNVMSDELKQIIKAILWFEESKLASIPGPPTPPPPPGRPVG